jgi:phosphoribosyl 1,2-cyclic phosphate phosphodiesterase
LLITPLEVIHGRLPVMGYRFNDFAYLTDLSEIPRSTLDALQALDVLVLDCLRFKEHPTHLWVDKALSYVEQLKPRRTFFTHIAHDIKHARDSVKLPAGVAFAYDGLEVDSLPIADCQLPI